jgi:hypothetical protein
MTKTSRKLVLIFFFVTGGPPASFCGAQAQPNQLDDHIALRLVVDDWVTNAETHVMRVADAMPEDKYSFAPAGAGFKGVRTFAQQLKHLAANNYYQAAIMLAQEPPEGTKGEVGPDSVKSKAEVMMYVKGSFESLHRAVATVDEKNVEHPIPGTSGTWQRSSVGRTVDAVAHSFNHYGQLVEYLRMNNIVPPDSR